MRDKLVYGILFVRLARAIARHNQKEIDKLIYMIEDCIAEDYASHDCKYSIDSGCVVCEDLQFISDYIKEVKMLLTNKQ